MKIEKFSPKRLFRKNKDRVSRSDPSSFGSGTSSSTSSDSSNHHHHRKPVSPPDSTGTPTSVLQARSGEWSFTSPEISCEIQSEKLHLRLLQPDSNGSVPISELEALLASLGAHPPTHEEVSMVLGKVDRGGSDGCVDMEALMSRLVGSVCEPDLKETFDFFDKDKDGKITAEELLSVYRSLGDEGLTLDECRRMIASVGKNENGFVCFEDFSKMMEFQR